MHLPIDLAGSQGSCPTYADVKVIKQHTEIASLLDEAKQLARKYKALTGKPLGITSEVGEFAAATLLGLELCQARQEGYDAIRIENE